MYICHQKNPKNIYLSSPKQCRHACNFRIIYFEMHEETKKISHSDRKQFRGGKGRHGQDVCWMWTAPDGAVMPSVQFHRERMYRHVVHRAVTLLMDSALLFDTFFLLLSLNQCLSIKNCLVLHLLNSPDINRMYENWQSWYETKQNNKLNDDNKLKCCIEGNCSSLGSSLQTTPLTYKSVMCSAVNINILIIATLKSASFIDLCLSFQKIKYSARKCV